jgi:hypothetical protein
MEQRVLIKIARLDDLTSMEIHSKLVALYGKVASTYSEARYWRTQFAMGWKDVDGAPGTG